jgi:hypothetical protein
MNLISTPWSCQRCGAAFISTPPEHGLCDLCLIELELSVRLAPIAHRPCPTCGGSACADCGKALIILTPIEAAELQPPLGEVSGDDG